MKDYQQRILSAIADFQRGTRKASRMAGGLAGRNRGSCDQRPHDRRINNQTVKRDMPLRASDQGGQS